MRRTRLWVGSADERQAALQLEHRAEEQWAPRPRSPRSTGLYRLWRRNPRQRFPPMRVAIPGAEDPLSQDVAYSAPRPTVAALSSLLVLQQDPCRILKLAGGLGCRLTFAPYRIDLLFHFRDARPEMFELLAKLPHAELALPPGDTCQSDSQQGVGKVSPSRTFCCRPHDQSSSILTSCSRGRPLRAARAFFSASLAARSCTFSSAYGVAFSISPSR